MFLFSSHKNIPKKLFAKYFKKYFSLYFFPRAFYDTLGVPFFMCAGAVLLVPSPPREGVRFSCFSLHGSGGSCSLLFMLLAYVYFSAATSFPVGREPLPGPGTRSFFPARRVTFRPSPTGGAGRKARRRAPEYVRRTHEGKERQRRSNTPPERKRRGWTRSGQLPRLCRARGGCFAEPPKSGNFYLKKESAHPHITDNNKCNFSSDGAATGAGYSLNAAKFTLVAQDGNYDPFEFKTGTDGRGSVSDIPIGTYWLYETTPSLGYSLPESANKDRDSTTYGVYLQEVEITEGDGGYNNTTKPHVTVKEVPHTDPLGLFLEKYDKLNKEEAGSNEPQGGASLAGAEFTFWYFGDIYDKDEVTSMIVSGENPSGVHCIKFTASTVGRNSSEGVIYSINFDARDYLQIKDWYDSNGKVRGDYFFGGRFQLGYGTLVVKETKAPDGYVLDDVTIVQLDSDSNPMSDTEVVDDYVVTHFERGSADAVTGDLQLQAFNKLTVKEGDVARGGVKVAKRDADSSSLDPQGDADLHPTSFRIYNANGNNVFVGPDLKLVAPDGYITTISTNPDRDDADYFLLYICP